MEEKMIKLYYHGSSENHGCEAIIRSTNKILNTDINFSQIYSNLKCNIEKFFQNIQTNNNEQNSTESTDNTENNEENIIQELNEKYFKIKDNLLRCGNLIFECDKNEIKKIQKS